MSILLDAMRRNNKAALSAAVASSPAVPKLPTIQLLVSRWQESDKPLQLTGTILKKLDKTIKAAMTSYAGLIKSSLAIPAANIAMQSLRTYDKTKGGSVLTHVFNALKRLNRVNTARSSIVHIPLGARILYNKIAQAGSALTELLGRLPSIQLLADTTGLSTKRVSQLLKQSPVVAQSNVLGIYANKDMDASSDLSDVDYVKYVYSTLGDIDRKILLWSTGMLGSPVLHGALIAKRLRISPAAVSQRRSRIQTQLLLIRSALA